MKKLYILVFIGLLYPFAGLCPSPTNNQRHSIEHAKKQLFFDTIYSKDFTTDLLRDALYYLDIIEPEVVYKQARLETGDFKSDIFIYGNNIFGMKLARSRETTAIGEFQYHARYYHWFLSVMDYKLLQDYYASKGYQMNDYLVFLEQMGYAEDLNYIKKLLDIS